MQNRRATLSRRAERGVRVACAAAVLSGGAALTAHAAEVRITTGAEGSVTITDNFDLEPEGQEQAAVVFTLGPTATIRADGGRFSFNLNGRLNFDTTVFEDDDTEFRVRPQLVGFGTAELIQDRFFIDLSGSWTRRLIDTDSPVSAVEVGDRRGTEDVQTVSISPYYVQRFGTWATAELRYRFSGVFVDSADADNSVTHEPSLLVQTGPRFSAFRLSGLLEYQRTTSDDSDEDGQLLLTNQGLVRETGDFERFTAELDSEWRLNRRLALLAGIGFDEVDSDDLTEADGPFGTIGFRAQPGPRTEITFRGGYRFGGTFLDGSARYQITPALALRVAVTDSLETTQTELTASQLGLIVGPTGEIINATTGVPFGLDGLGFGVRDEFFRTRIYQASLAGAYRTDSYLLSVLYEQRDFEFRGDENVAGVTARWQRQLSPNLSAGLALGYRRVDDDDDFNDVNTNNGIDDGDGVTNTFTAQPFVNYNLYENLTLSASYARSQRFADDPNDEYTENAVILGVRLRF